MAAHPQFLIMIEQWHAIQTIGKREAAAAACLERAAIETLLPFYKYRVVRTYKRYYGDFCQTVKQDSEATEPLFPGYLFARFAIEEWPLIRRERGVRVVRVGEQPAVVEEWIIEGIRLRMNESGVTVPVKPVYADLEPGSLVVGCGNTSWAGITGVFLEGLKGGERVAVLMNLLGCERRVILPRADVEPVFQSAAVVQA